MKIDPEEINLSKLAQEYSDDKKARSLFESWRWPDGKPICPHCKHNEAYQLESKPETKEKNRMRDGVYCCAACRKQFSATVGTILEDSHLPISKWVMAIFIMCSAKKSISAHQMHRMLGITYKTSWFMCHRIRHALAPSGEGLLSGTVEVDETFIGGKGDAKTKLSRKTPVVALVERGGDIRTRVVANVTQKNLKQAINECVDKSATINTDESGVYRGQLKAFKAHHSVNHSKKQYAVEMAGGEVKHVNTAESFFSLLKRGVHGSWHHISREHLPKYANEFAFRWNHRTLKDGERMQKAILQVEGKRLKYRDSSPSEKSSG